MSSNSDRATGARAAGPRSLRARLQRSLLLGTGLILLVLGLVLDRLVEAWMAGDFDRALTAQARAFVSLSEQDGRAVELDYVPELMPAFDREEDPDYFEMWLHGAGGAGDEGEGEGEGDEVFARSPSLAGGDLARQADRSSRARLRDVRLPDGREGRQVQVEFVPLIEEEGEGGEEEGEWDSGDLGDIGDAEDEEEDEAEDEEGDSGTVAAPAGFRSATIVVAAGRDELDERLLVLRLGLAGISLTLMAAIALLVRWSVGRGLAPLTAMALEVEALDADRLDQRLQTAPVGELAPLERKLNDLLARLAAVFERERRFSADVAHELRTPIAELRSLAEVGGRWPGDERAVRGFFADVGEIAGQMQRIVVQLLSLARAEAGFDRPASRRIELGRLLDEVWASLETEAKAREVGLQAVFPSPLWLRSDPDKLQLVLHNVLGNAVSHGRAGSEVRVELEWEQARLLLVVSNRVDDLGPADLEHVFERFWRKDPARSAGNGSGLGLPLVAALVRELGLAVEVGLEGDLFVLSLAFPLASVEAAPVAVAS